jgi:hypothetical protein
MLEILKVGSPKKIKLAQVMGTKVTTNVSGAKASQGLKTTRKNQQAKSH